MHIDDDTQNVTKIKSHLVIDMQNHHDIIKEKLSDQPRKVLILNTGGTISMFPSSSGYVTKTGALKNFLQNNPFSCDMDYTYFKATDDFLITPITAFNRRIWFKVDELDKLLDSSNMTSDDWVTIAERIEKAYKYYDSFIILHGTDTMAYTASALSFMFQNLSKTVILTGSQVPLSQPRNDGFTNFLNALTIAGHFTIPEVLICFQDKLLRGNRAQKVNSSSLDSFDSPKFTPLGYFGVNISIKWDIIMKNPNEENLQVNKKFCTNISLIRLNPLLNHVTLNEIFKNEKLKGVVIETYGAGNMQTEEKFCNEIAQAAKRGIVIVNISQCHTSQVEMIYETGIIFENMGVISGGDMTSQAAFTKLGYLLAQTDDVDKVKDEFQRNIRGELTESGGTAETEPFLMALSSAIKQQHSKIDLNKDLVFPNILCQICVQKKKLSSMKLSKIEINYKAQDYDKRSILHVAAREGSLEIAELILRKCPEIVNNVDRWKHSAMYEAVMAKNTQMIQLLLRFQGKLIAPIKELTQLLMLDIANGKGEMLNLFYEAGERDFTQYKTEDNRTVAHLAVSVGNDAALQFLSNPGVIFDWQVQDKFGRIPKDEKILQKRLLKR
ncbi:unnamed protein product [Paramecium pentaurelia]|uniref:asparaginase n=1 Tax=Paramecium pentaurelia TaxID=43138 RepID=A0A8S1WEQ7_9CILI|nr:unnamed protein product [Paramecium pentaurelia]